ncbi:putative glycosyl hydrolase [Actinoplanes missouriensis 431]|uniref:alpha-amylase n=1 Tax=Actinoplanes missouriensis (strain ATCC 14538 / DSM 43046 / CBS 188.64 / JCM 3121 / NBRC 102363 / NCIMB 12654 / NRRL B-3342 / UNCC 431) TaxID=512565 RepID=I0H1I7_ACTM4|nr:pullulanase-type alpha-1,6-glucosidase [Actinoplanes missouriensis]BAL86874.1 putative glycosyl hydrolase [Actinoplanes missouriensis 431]
MTTIEITATAPPVEGRTRPQWLLVHYHRPDGDYADWALHAWGDVAEEMVYPSGVPFAGEDSYGRFAWVRLAENAHEVGFLIVHRHGAKDVDVDRWVDVSEKSEIWLIADERRVQEAPLPDTTVENTAVIHYRRPDGDYSGWGLHCWEGVPAKSKTPWGTPMLPSRFDAFGAVFEVPVRPDAVGLRFVLHRGELKDLPDDQRLDLTVARELWVLAGVAAPVRPDLGTLGPELDPARALAVFVDRGTIALPDWFASRAATLSLNDLTLVPRPGGLFQAQSRRFPHLRAYRAFALREMSDAALGELLRGRLLVTGRDAAGEVVALTSVQLAGVLDDVYAEAADADLGLTFDDEQRPQLAVWAPTAITVELELFRETTDEPRILPMERDPVTGVWSVTGKRKWLGRYYRYRVELWHPAAQRVVTTSVTDPYSISLATDSTHSQLVDLDDPALRPSGWDELAKPPAVAPARMQIAEVSVRDFSIFDASVPAGERGTFLAFTRAGSDGMRHLRSLADAGLTHAHLLPVNDFATVPDRRADQAVPVCDLASFPPDSEEQQRAVMAVADTDGYNWGYDPWHWTTPEGGYATDPAGPARILELRSAVAALNAAGLRVVLDVVYNHTMGDGLDRFSVLDRIVPGYYHRLLADGSTAESTCCPNTATEHMMMSKLVIDSLVTWASSYKIDGFRFDLMGHHPRANILEARIALDRLGDHGRDICLYGEGWNFGEVAYDARFAQATQVNMAGTGVGTFNDRLRDAVRGGGSFGDDPGVRGFATGLGADTPLWLHDQIKVGLSGALATYRFVTHTGVEHSGAQIDYNGSPSGYAHDPGEAINYVDAHDNEILYDAMAFKLPRDLPALDRARMQVLALSLVVLSQGAGFVALGSERLRSKSLDRNSFNSGDWFNQIRWDPGLGNGFGLGLPPYPDNGDKWNFARPLLADPRLVMPPDAITLAAERYRELLRIRRSSPVFGLPTADEVQRRLTFPRGGPDETPGVIVMCLDGTGLDPRWRTVVVVFNATEHDVVEELPGVTGLRLHPELIESADPILRTARAAGSGLVVPTRSVAVFVND